MDTFLQSIPYYYLLPLIVVVALAFPFVMMRLTDVLYAKYRVGNIARRMGLTLAEGDPKLNLVQATQEHAAKFETGTGGSFLSRFLNSTKETKVRLVGAPHGRPTEFVYWRRHDTKDRLVVITQESWFECRMSLQVPVAFPEFEIVRQRPHMGVYGPKPQPELPLPPQRFGAPQLDSTLKLTAAEPRLGPALAPAVAPLGSLEFVHVQGRNGAIHWLANEEGSMYACRRLPEAQQVLERIADVLAGPVRRSH
jgi:hypothetical protein